MKLFQRTQLTDRQERALEKTVQQIRIQRRNRFRVLACINTGDDSFDTVRMAARLAPTDDCDIIVLFVRPVDQGLWSGGLQVRLARQNLLEAGFELPGISHLKRAIEILKEEGIDAESWPRLAGHQDAWGDPLGDNKIEYQSPAGRTVVLKLKTAPDVADGILDQYELGPYNLMILGEPSSWRGEVQSLFSAGVVQRVTMLSPCSVLIVRPSEGKQGFFVCTDGSSRSMQAVRRAAVLAHTIGEPVTLFSAAPDEQARAAAEENVENAKALLKALGIAVAEARVAIGNPVECITRLGASFRIIVVTDEGRSWWQRLWRGSVAYEVVRDAPTSVLDVR
ncbi:MAG: universal stress protein [Pseudomonadota bacterium]|nr:universal stress protein [Pseudomonadota bacterium]